MFAIFYGFCFNKELYYKPYIFIEDKTLIIDLHIHSDMNPDCHLSATQIIQHVQEAGLDGIAFTNNHPYNPEDIEKIRQEGERLGVKTFFGYEITTKIARLVFFLPKPFDVFEKYGWSISTSETLDTQQVIDSITEEEGCCIISHPFDKRNQVVCGDRIFSLRDFDAIEVVNFRCQKGFNDMAVEAAYNMRVSSVGGSDASNNFDEIGQVGTTFKNPVETQQDLIREIKGGDIWAVEIGVKHKYVSSSRGQGPHRYDGRPDGRHRGGSRRYDGGGRE